MIAGSAVTAMVPVRSISYVPLVVSKSAVLISLASEAKFVAVPRLVVTGAAGGARVLEVMTTNARAGHRRMPSLDVYAWLRVVCGLSSMTQFYVVSVPNR